MVRARRHFEQGLELEPFDSVLVRPGTLQGERPPQPTHMHRYTHTGVNAHPSPRPQPLDRRLTLHAAACGQQTPHREQQQEPLLLGQSLAGAPLPPFFQAPLSAIKGQGTPRCAPSEKGKGSGHTQVRAL
eukprot:1161054-Pelagomonas_calceolata.AAC.3